eukprot:14596361-Alexandrium_andersonii.AAC.1
MTVVEQQGALQNASVRHPCMDSAGAFIPPAVAACPLMCAMVAVRGRAHCRTSRWEVAGAGEVILRVV